MYLNKKVFEETYQEKDKEDEKNIYFKRRNIYKNYIKNHSHINHILEIFKSIVKCEDTLFDLSPEYDKWISFRNGIYNLDTNEFRPRNISDRFTLALNWDYKCEYCKSCFDDINLFFKKIQPNEEQRTFTVSFLKYCLKGGNPQRLYKMNIDTFLNIFGVLV